MPLRSRLHRGLWMVVTKWWLGFFVFIVGGGDNVVVGVGYMVVVTSRNLHM